MVNKNYRPWLRALSGLFINISAAFFVAAFIGPTILFPKNPEQFVSLTLNIGFGILFLLTTVMLERMLEKYE